MQALVPVWIQKSFGPWTTYGGGGLAFAPDGRNWLAGWLLQRELSERLVLGVEVFVAAPLGHGPAAVRVSPGAIVNLSEHHHVLASAGPSFGDDRAWQAYLGYQLTR